MLDPFNIESFCWESTCHNLLSSRLAGAEFSSQSGWDLHFSISMGLWVLIYKINLLHISMQIYANTCFPPKQQQQPTLIWHLLIPWSSLLGLVSRLQQSLYFSLTNAGWYPQADPYNSPSYLFFFLFVSSGRALQEWKESQAVLGDQVPKWVTLSLPGGEILMHVMCWSDWSTLPQLLIPHVFELHLQISLVRLTHMGVCVCVCVTVWRKLLWNKAQDKELLENDSLISLPHYHFSVFYRIHLPITSFSISLSTES